MRSTHLEFLALATGALLMCVGCSDDRIDRIYGELGVVHTGTDGQTRTDRSATFDYQAVFMGQKASRKIAVKNLGRGALTLQSLELVEGADGLRVNGDGVENPVWSVSFPAGKSLRSSELIELDTVFSPPLPMNDEVQQRDHALTLLLRVQNARPGEETATIALVGRAVAGNCRLPEFLDFGSVAVQDTFRLSVEIRNPTPLAASARVGEIYTNSGSGDQQAFTFAPGLPNGDVEVPPNSTRTVELDFRPTEVKSYLALLKMRASDQCPEQVIELRGVGVDRVLSWVPPQVDCGYVTPALEVTREVTFTNTGSSDVHLSQIQLLNRDEFRVVAAQGVDATRLVVAGNNGTAKLSVACKPADLGPRTTQLTFSTDLPRQPAGNIPVRTYGGGPDIDVTPFPTLNFGQVGYFEGVALRRKLVVMNVGTPPPTPDVQANLLLGRRDGSGRLMSTVDPPTPLNTNTAPGEFTVTVPTTYDPAVGLEGRVGKNIVELVVTLIPRSAGPKQAQITLHSNDPDEPTVDITVSADAIVSPPCNYTVSPTTVSFGLVQPPQSRDLAFTVKNNGTQPSEICYLSSLDIASGSHSFFSLPNAPIENKQLAPGEVMQVLVRAWPQGAATPGVTHIEGAVEFSMSSPVRPTASVKLTAEIAAACLTIAPNDLDFGTVQAGCSSATRTFSIYNTCSGSVTINSFRILGAPANDPSCLKSAGCEYFLVRAPAIPAGGLTINPGDAPTTFEVKYSPLDFGQDTNAVEIGATENAANVRYVVSLKGAGDSQGLQTDVFTQDAKPKADILLVVDNSCSMTDKQQSLATNFASFIKYAQTAQVDYHLAVTTTDMCPEGRTECTPGERGRFISDPATHPEKILTPNTIDLEKKFTEKVKVGTAGWGFERGAEPALTALTAPLINSENAGFLRDDAALAVVVVSDENDQSPNTRTYYLDQLWNIKGHNRKTMFTFNVIAWFDLQCTGIPDWQDEPLGPGHGEYAFYTAQTNGIREEICTPDWAKALERLGKSAFGFRTNFFLTSKPDLGKGPIQVKIDNQLVPSTDGRGTIWTYDPVANSVNFQPLFVPEPGQTLTISYHVTCFP